MLAAVDWHIVWERLFHPDHVFLRALWTTVYIAVAAQVLGVVLGLIAALMRMSQLAAAAVALGLLRAHLPRHAAARADLLRLLRRQPALRLHADPERR